MSIENIPLAMRELNQWILWRLVERDGKETKLPYQTDGKPAKSNDRSTWDSFVNVRQWLYQYSGLGFVFSADDDFIGIDLDGCRDPQNGMVADWAKEIILKFSAYAEVSPSQTGVKIFCRGKSPFGNGRKIAVEVEATTDKTPAIEVYDRGRYFAVTGLVLRGQTEPHERQEAIDWLKEKYFRDEPAKPIQDFRSNDAVVERARKYLAKLPAAISGQSGHNATFHAACVLVLGFELSESDAIGLMGDFNARCVPPWGEKEIARKVREASKQPGPRGYLRNVAPANWDRVRVPPTTPAKPEEPETEIITLADASLQFLESIKSGKSNLITTSIFDLDYALGGGVEYGEMVVFAARPSHGKSAIALQCLHEWTRIGLPCCMVSEEMSSLMLGKRTVQHITSLNSEHWLTQSDKVEGELRRYKDTHAPCYILDGNRTAQKAAERIERCVDDYGVRCAVVDYAQLLQSPGRGRYEQITNTSITLRQIASRLKIVLLVLCQLNRAVEGRQGKFMPTIADIKDSGQIEQDADVISLLVWPHRVDKDEPRNMYQFYVAKNRNRQINDYVVNCHFEPSRQAFRDQFPNEFEHAESEGIPS